MPWICKCGRELKFKRGVARCACGRVWLMKVKSRHPVLARIPHKEKEVKKDG